MRRFPILVLVVAVLGTTAFTFAPDEQPIRFAPGSELAVGPEPVEVELLNDSPADHRIVSVTGTLVTPLEIAWPGGEIPSVPSGGNVRFTVRAVPVVSPTVTGWLVVALESNGNRVIVRRSVKFTVPLAKPGVSSWSVTSTTRWPSSRAGGELEGALPVAGGNQVSGMLASGNDVITVSGTYRTETRSMALSVENYPAIGTYSGKLKVGETDVDVTIVRTASAWLATAMILLGLFAAAFVMRKTDLAWVSQYRRWLYALPGRAEDVDPAVAPAVKARQRELLVELDRILGGITPLLRWLPLPDNYMTAERAKLLDDIQELNGFVSGRHSMPQATEDARKAFETAAADLSHAPGLEERAAQILDHRDQPGFAELVKRAEEIRALPGALDSLRWLLKIRPKADELQNGKANLTAGARTALDALFLRLDEAMSVFHRETSAVTIDQEVDVIRTEAARLAGSLALRADAPALRHAGFDLDPLAEALSTVTGLLTDQPKAAPAPDNALTRVGPWVGTVVLVLVIVAVGVLTGLPVLYYGEAWGDALDFVAAFVWGFGAATVLTPAVTALKTLSSRPADATPLT
jgi:hypothetical protein